MSDRLNLGDTWACAHIQSKDPRAMLQHGPNIRVAITAIDKNGTRLAQQEGGAIIDSGAESCCVSPTMFNMLKGGLEGTQNVSHVYGDVSNQRTIRASISWMNGVKFTRDFALLEHLEPYHVLIGRDILKECHFYLDQGAGQFWLYAPFNDPTWSPTTSPPIENSAASE